MRMVSRPSCLCMAENRVPRAGFSDRLSGCKSQIAGTLEKHADTNTVVNTPSEVQVVIGQHDHLQTWAVVFWIDELVFQIFLDLLRPPRFSRGGITGDGYESHTILDPTCT